MGNHSWGNITGQVVRSPPAYSILTRTVNRTTSLTTSNYDVLAHRSILLNLLLLVCNVVIGVHEGQDYRMDYRSIPAFTTRFCWIYFPSPLPNLEVGTIDRAADR